MTPERFARLQAILARRQPDLTLLLDNVRKSRNFSALLRTCDAVGIHRVHFEAQRQREVAGMYQQRRLPDAEYDRTLFEWAHPRVAQHCRRHGLAYPALDESGGIADSLEQEKTAE